jgi:hypothetical protein
MLDYGGGCEVANGSSAGGRNEDDDSGSGAESEVKDGAIGEVADGSDDNNGGDGDVAIGNAEKNMDANSGEQRRRIPSKKRPRIGSCKKPYWC